MLEELKTADKVVGIKQLRKALADGRVKKAFIAEDADPALTAPIIAQCQETNVTVISVATMRQLGEACRIPVNAAAAAIV